MSQINREYNVIIEIKSIILSKYNERDMKISSTNERDMKISSTKNQTSTSSKWRTRHASETFPKRDRAAWRIEPE
jgi:hypothetical protein